MRRLTAVILLLTGCTTLTPAQESAAAAVRAFAERTAKVYGLWKPGVVVGADVLGQGAYYKQGTLFVSTTSLGQSWTDAVLAHEMAHYVLGHEPIIEPLGRSALDARLYDREIDAHAKAVEILSRVKGIDEAAALMEMHRYLMGARRAEQRAGYVIPFGHKSACVEAGEMLARFPKYRAWTEKLECVPSTWNAEK